MEEEEKRNERAKRERETVRISEEEVWPTKIRGPNASETSKYGYVRKSMELVSFLQLKQVTLH